jgi:hypothetical protein
MVTMVPDGRGYRFHQGTHAAETLSIERDFRSRGEHICRGHFFGKCTQEYGSALKGVGVILDALVRGAAICIEKSM